MRSFLYCLCSSPIPHLGWAALWSFSQKLWESTLTQATVFEAVKVSKDWQILGPGTIDVDHANPRNYHLGSPVTTVHRFLFLHTPHFRLDQSRETEGFSLLHYLETAGLLASWKQATPRPQRRSPPSPSLDIWLGGRKQGTKHCIWTNHSVSPMGIDGWVLEEPSESIIPFGLSPITSVNLQQDLSLYLYIYFLLASSLLPSTCNHSEVLNQGPLVPMCLWKMCSWKSFE